MRLFVERWLSWFSFHQTVAVQLGPDEIEARLPVWRALSNLFLDTELQSDDYRFIAESLRESGFPLAQIEEILWNEVFPALADNLRIITGEWSGFSEDWLRERIPAVLNGDRRGMGRTGLISGNAVRKIIAEEWAEVSRQVGF